MNADRLRIAQIDQYPECIGTVVDWIVKKWSTSSPEEVKQMLLENKECPPALVAVFDDGPVAVLAYKLHRLAQRDSVELWVNALYVASPWRGQGVGSHILCEGVKGARRRPIGMAQAGEWPVRESWRWRMPACTIQSKRPRRAIGFLNIRLTNTTKMSPTRTGITTACFIAARQCTNSAVVIGRNSILQPSGR